MCMICASIPIAAAAGSKLSAAQLHKPAGERKPVGRLTALVVGLLVVLSFVYHTLRWQGQ